MSGELTLPGWAGIREGYTDDEPVVGFCLPVSVGFGDGGSAYDQQGGLRLMG